MDSSLAALQKIKQSFPCLAVPHPGSYPRKLKISQTYTQMFVRLLFIMTADEQKWNKCKIKCVYSHSGILFSHKKGTKQWYMPWSGWNLDKPWKHAKSKKSVFCGLYCIIPFTDNVQNRQIHRQKLDKGCWGPEVGWGGERLLMGFLTEVMKIIWVLMVRVVQLCEYTKNYRTLYALKGGTLWV